jgi:hypothetical protein
MSAAICFLFPDRQCKRAIHIKRRDCGASCDSHNLYSFPAEMCLPGVETWVEEGNVLARLRIRYEHPTTFAKRARDACQCEIFQRRTSACDHWHHVVDVKGRFLSGLSKPQYSQWLSARSITCRRRPAETAIVPSPQVFTRSDRIRSSESSSAKSTKPSASCRSASVKAVPMSCLSSSSVSRR